jgi:hypothetical protein
MHQGRAHTAHRTSRQQPLFTFDGPDLIALAFGAFNILRLASYVPQIIAVRGMAEALRKPTKGNGEIDPFQTP